jgi:hypothetical protein
MNVGKYIYSVLSNDAGVSALVGDRIYPVLIAEDAAFPAIEFSVSSVPLDSQKTQVSDHDSEVVTFHLWADALQGADAYSSSCDIDAAVRTAFDFVEGTAGGVTVEHCHFDSSKDILSEDRRLIGKEVAYTFITKN